MGERSRTPWWVWPLFVVLLPFVAVALLLWLVGAVLLQVVIWMVWCPRGRYALLIYSDSPVWREYFEADVLPAAGTRAVVLNWSERESWEWSLAVVAFRFFGGSREFNPMAVVFRPFAWARRFRFYRAFRAFKHGRSEEIEKLQRQFVELLDELAPLKAA